MIVAAQVRSVLRIYRMCWAEICYKYHTSLQQYCKIADIGILNFWLPAAAAAAALWRWDAPQIPHQSAVSKPWAMLACEGWRGSQPNSKRFIIKTFFIAVSG